MSTNDCTPSTTFIYALLDSRTGCVRYVGKSDNPDDRLLRHCRGTRCNRHKDNWLKQLEAAGLYPVLQILEECPHEVWRERECNWIAYFRDAGEPLTNKTDGGEGQSKGWIPSPETRARMSLANAAATSTPEARASRSERSKAMWRDPVTRGNLLAGARRAAATVEYCAHASMRGQLRYADLEERERTAATTRESWANPDIRAKRMAALTSPETRAKMSASAKARHKRERAQRDADVSG